MKYVTMICVTFLSLLLCACTQSSVDPEAEQAALLAAADAHHEAAHSGDFGSMADYYANDGLMMEPHAAEIQGLQGVRNFFDAGAEIPELRLRFSDVRAEVAASGDMGYTLADLEIRAKGRDGEPWENKYRDFHLWKKQGGEWKIAIDIWNAELPWPVCAAAVIEP
jgi:ketosteroid isomerase-like protein